MSGQDYLKSIIKKHNDTLDKYLNLLVLYDELMEHFKSLKSKANEQKIQDVSKYLNKKIKKLDRKLSFLSDLLDLKEAKERENDGL